MYKLLLYLLNF